MTIVRKTSSRESTFIVTELERSILSIDMKNNNTDKISSASNEQDREDSLECFTCGKIFKPNEEYYATPFGIKCKECKKAEL